MRYVMQGGKPSRVVRKMLIETKRLYFVLSISPINIWAWLVSLLSQRDNLGCIHGLEHGPFRADEIRKALFDCMENGSIHGTIWVQEILKKDGVSLRDVTANKIKGNSSSNFVVWS